jgi:hypothetical protein
VIAVDTPALHSTDTIVPLGAGLPLTVALLAQPGIRILALQLAVLGVTLMVAVSPNGYLESVTIVPPPPTEGGRVAEEGTREATTTASLALAPTAPAAAGSMT